MRTTARRGLSCVLVLAASIVGCRSSRTPAAPPPSQTQVQRATLEAQKPPSPLAPLAAEATKLDGLGVYRWPIATREAEAQHFFNQGMRLYWAFNHEEALRSFAKAAEIDPRCTMCFWGAALTLGPNYNMPMMPERAALAWQALEKARAIAPAAPPEERALVSALGARYAGPNPVDEQTQQFHSKAYADAMAAIAKRLPNDVDVQALYAEALMDLNPWKLWTKDGKPAEGTPAILATLEAALAKDPSHPGLNHLYVHAVEASPEPGRGVAAADRLGPMMPNAGHLTHMPSHIYQRVGRYEDAAAANRRAIEADRRYVEAIAPREPPHVYEMYMGHNHQFLAYSSMMQGSGAEAVAAAQNGGKISLHAAEEMPMIEFYAALPYVMMMRFGKGPELFAAPPPNARFRTATALWHHARGMSFAASARVPEAEAELRALSAIATSIPRDQMSMMNKSTDLLAIATMVLEGRLAQLRGDVTTAIARLQDAVNLEDELTYQEPPDWWYPVRHVLGATLIEMNRAAAAEKVYREDLRRNPENGWSLRGLARALEIQGKKSEASSITARARTAWKHADIQPRTSWL